MIARARELSAIERFVAASADRPSVLLTDFPKPAAAPVSAADPIVPPATLSRTDWGDVAIGGGIGAALAALLAYSGLVLTRRARPAQG